VTFENGCRDCGVVLELVAQKLDSPLPSCPQCGAVMERLVSAPAVVWSKPMAAYGDRSKEGFTKQDKAGGHWALEKTDDGTVHKTFIDTPQANREYCKRNHLMNPADLPSNLSIAKDGRSYETANKCEI